MIGIYKITNPNNEIYVGQSTNIENRWNKDYKTLRCKTQPKLYNSLKKYGPENHKFEIVEECVIEQLLMRETYYKNLYKVLEVPSLCCRTDGRFGHMSQETKDKIKLWNINVGASEDARKKMSSAASYKRSEETKRKMSEARKKYFENKKLNYAS